MSSDPSPPTQVDETAVAVSAPVRPGPSKARRAATAAIALAVTVAAGGYTWSVYEPPPTRPDDPLLRRAARAEAKSEPKPWGDMYVSPDSGDLISILTIQEAGPTGRPTAFMGKPTGPTTLGGIVNYSQKILDRELVRQAFLIAARDERGLSTRDELLDGAAPPPAGGATPLDVSSIFRSKGVSRVLVRPLDGKEDRGLITPIVAKPLGDDPFIDDYTERLTATLEGTTRAEFAELLDKYGGKGEPNRVVAEGPLPEGASARLETLGLVDHFAAIRDLHRSIRADGESPERLGALARAYAQLGALTVHHWSPAHRAFQARALLYAERLVARGPQSAWALRNRAFVRALVGFHGTAAKDLEAASAIDAGAEKPAAAPAWVDVIDAAIRYDLPRLAAVQGPHARLAALLRMGDSEYPPRTRMLVASAEAVLGLDPGCDRAFDVIGDHGELNDRHRSTGVGPEAFRVIFREKLKAAAGLPEPVRKALDRNADDLALTASLDEAGGRADDGEPAWGVLAQLAREARFAQVRQRLDFMANSWGVPVDEYWADARPLVEGHRYRPYLGALTRDPEEVRAFAESTRTLDWIDLEAAQAPMITLMEPDRKKLGRGYWYVLETRASTDARDIGDHMVHFVQTMAEGKVAAERLLRISPHNPYAKGALVREDWEHAQAKLDEWKRTDGDKAAFQRALGYQYFDLKRYAEAREWLSKFVRQSPDRVPFESLAESYEKEGDRERWLATLDDYLANTEESGLSHAQVRVKIANDYLSRNEPEKAKPYADEAAQTWAAWAMLCALDVDERLGDLEGAEAWAANVSERYANQWHAWYFLCRRTGRGDVDSARGLAAAAVRRPGLAQPPGQAYFHWVDGNPDEAARVLERFYEAQPDPGFGGLLALLHDQTGATAKRDALMKRLVEDLKPLQPSMSSMFALFVEAAARDAKPLDLAAADAIVDAGPPDYRATFQFVLGRFLLNRGRPDDARKYLEPAAGFANDNIWSRTCAGVWLREITPEPKKPEPKEPAPAPRPGDAATRT